MLINSPSSSGMRRETQSNQEIETHPVLLAVPILQAIRAAQGQYRFALVLKTPFLDSLPRRTA